MVKRMSSFLHEEGNSLAGTSVSPSETDRLRSPTANPVHKIALPSCGHTTFTGHPFRTIEAGSMSRTFAYLRVSTVDPTTANPLHEIAAAGFSSHPRRLAPQHLPGPVAPQTRQGFARLRARLAA